MTDDITKELNLCKRHLFMALKHASRVEQLIFIDDLLSEHDDCIMRADGLFTAIKRAISGVSDDITTHNIRMYGNVKVKMKTPYIGEVLK